MKILENFFSNHIYDNQAYLFIPSARHPRLIIPLVNRGVYKRGFAIHNTASAKNKIKKYFLINTFYLQKRFNFNKRYASNELFDLINFVKQKLNIIKPLYFSIYVGTRGVLNRKLTFQLFDSQLNVIGYLKVSDTLYSKKFIENENLIIEQLNLIKPKTFEYPFKSVLLKYKNLDLLFLSDCAKNSSEVNLNLNSLIFNSLIEFSHFKLTSSSKNEYLNNLLEKLKMLHPSLFDGNLFNYIENVFNELKSVKFNLVFVHNDFVKYNLRYRDKKLVIFDFEFANKEGLPFSDLFHFLLQGYYQIKKMPIEKIVNLIFYNNSKFLSKYASTITVPPKYIKSFFTIYLIERLIFDSNTKLNFRLINSQFYKALIIMYTRNNGLYS